MFPGGYIVEYELNNSIFQLFIIEFQNKNETNAILKQYLSYIGFPENLPGSKIEPINDKNIGPLLIAAKDRFIVGSKNILDSVIQKEYIKKFLDQIQHYR